MNKQDIQLQKLTEAIERLIASPVAPVLPIAPVAPVAPVLPINPVNSGDHDLIVALNVKMEDLKTSIKELKDGTSTKIDDHEARIKKNSDDVLVVKTQMKTWGVALGAILTIIEVISHYLLK